MVHAAAGYARMRNRLGALACTTSIGPGRRTWSGGCARHRQPAAGAPHTGRRLRVAQAGPGAPAARGAVGGRHLGERLLPASLSLLRPDLAPRASPVGGDGSAAFMALGPFIALASLLVVRFRVRQTRSGLASAWRRQPRRCQN